MTVRQTVNLKKGGGRQIGSGKTDSRRRTVSIPPHVVPDLQRHLDQYAEEGPEGWLFVGPRGGQIAPSNFRLKVWDVKARVPWRA